MKKHRNHKLRKVYYEFYSYNDEKAHPLIKIAGNYLEQFGFMIGDRIKVQIEKEKILIERISGDT